MNGTILIAMIMLSVIGFVVLLFAVQSRRMNDKKKNEMLQVYNSLVTKNDLDIIEEDKLANRIFAIDPVKKVFVFVYNFSEPVYDIIRLDNSMVCKIKSTGSKIAIKKGKGKTSYEEHISDIYLSFMSKGNLIIDVPVYNEIHDGLLEKMNLLAIAEKWQQKINTVVLP